MRIFSKKSLQFHHPKDRSIVAVVRAGEFATVPDWVPDSAMFKLTAKDESVTVIENKEQEIKAEKDADKPVKTRGARNGGRTDKESDDPATPSTDEQTPDGGSTGSGQTDE